ncbi:MAG TPA: sigma factor-like helix-turn-helix DNA-binding protein [Patescibacteria group bacterium]|nr:sigma factor-like helix-turn-helix DNA-binding protein [Patescibacteria group bacterium]
MTSQLPKISDLREKTEKNPDFFDLADQILSFLPERTKDIVKKRYGLFSEKSETLESIGKSYGITRERVRQIVSEARKNILANLNGTDFSLIEERLVFTIEKNSDIIKEEEIVNMFNWDGVATANAIKFLASCSSRIDIREDKEILQRVWTVSTDAEEKAKKIVAKAEEFLRSEKKTQETEKIIKKINRFFPEMTQREILNYLKTSAKIKENRFGKWGMFDWPEISPKGTREKVYLVLKEKKQPLHFAEIAGLIDEFKLGKKKAHPQTVHNELIKDDRFVLIGRGMYALAEWGYQEGTIKDVLEDIIGNSNHPISREKILEEVLKRRKVKKSTVLINLNNRGTFEKIDNTYILKK